jgi:hypothetical protein
MPVLEPESPAFFAATSPPDRSAALAAVAMQGGTHEQVDDVYCLAVRMHAEWQRTGTVRILAEVEAPVRLAYEERPSAVRSGVLARVVSPNVPDALLLPDDMRGAMRAAYTRSRKARDWVVVAAAARAWNDYHHTMRQILPPTWVSDDTFRSAAAIVDDALRDADADVAFDVPLLVDVGGTALCTRAHAADSKRVWHFVLADDTTTEHRNNAAIRAALCTGKQTLLVNLRSGKVDHVSVIDAVPFLERVLAE